MIASLTMKAEPAELALSRGPSSAIRREIAIGV